MDEIISDVGFPDEVLLAMVKSDSRLSREEAEAYIRGLRQAIKEGINPFRNYCLLHSSLYGGRTVFTLGNFTDYGWENFRERLLN